MLVVTEVMVVMVTEIFLNDSEEQPDILEP